MLSKFGGKSSMIIVKRISAKEREIVTKDGCTKSITLPTTDSAKVVLGVACYSTSGLHPWKGKIEAFFETKIKTFFILGKWLQ